MKVTITETINTVIGVTEQKTEITIADFSMAERRTWAASEATTTTASADITLTNASNLIQYIDPGGASRIVNLPSAGLNNHGFVIINTADANGELLTIKSGSTIVGLLPRGYSDFYLSNGTIWTASNRPLGIISPNGYQTPCGRLTLESGKPVSTTDQSAKATLYYTPYVGNLIDLCDGTNWQTLIFTETSLDIASFSDAKNYDIFAYDNAGTATLEGLVWTDGTTRATALAYQDGILVKSGDATRRYLGTIRTSAAGQCSDTATFRGVWNYYNRVARTLFSYEATSHTYNGAARLWNNSTTNNQVSFVIGVEEECLLFSLLADNINAGADGSYAQVYVYRNGSIAAPKVFNYNVQKISMYISAPQSSVTPAGYHYLNVYEAGNHNSSNFGACGLRANIRM